MGCFRDCESQADAASRTKAQRKRAPGGARDFLRAASRRDADQKLWLMPTE
jgi:hypothetical protein